MDTSNKMLLSVWIAIFGVINFVWFFAKTINIFSTLKLLGLTLFITPSGLIWLVVVSGCWYACIGLLVRIWRKDIQHKMLFFLLLPPALSLLIVFLGEGFYPLIIDGNGESYLKMFPFFK